MVTPLALSNGLVSKAVPSPKKSATLFERALLASLADRTGKLGAYSVAATLESLRFSAFAVRERLALEQWTLVATSATEFDAAMAGAVSETRNTQQALRALERLTTNVMAMTGAQTDRMTRDDGWRMLSMGRHIERLSTLAEALSEAFDTGTLNSDIGFSLVLSFFDSTITYRSRYLQQRDPQALVELLALDRDNPRSLAWISQSLSGRIAKLMGLPSRSVPPMLASFALPHQWQDESTLLMAGADDSDAIINLLRGARSDAFAISDALSQRYFSHAEAADTVVGA